MNPPAMTDAEMRRRMAREVLEGTKDRLENSPPIGWDPVTKTIRTEMPALRVVPDDPPDRARASSGSTARARSPADGR